MKIDEVRETIELAKIAIEATSPPSNVQCYENDRLRTALSQFSAGWLDKQKEQLNREETV